MTFPVTHIHRRYKYTVHLRVIECNQPDCILTQISVFSARAAIHCTTRTSTYMQERGRLVYHSVSIFESILWQRLHFHCFIFAGRCTVKSVYLSDYALLTDPVNCQTRFLNKNIIVRAHRSESLNDSCVRISITGLQMTRNFFGGVQEYQPVSSGNMLRQLSQPADPLI